MPRRSNVILITTDQHRYGSVGFNGNPNVRTPNLNALAGASVMLDHCYVPCGVCAPSRASLMTGRYPHLHGQLSNGFSMRPDEVTWWQLLASAGYRTAGIGKMHAEPWDDPLGFEDRVIIEGKDWLLGRDEYANFLRRQGYPFNRPRETPGTERLHWSIPRLSPVPAEHYIDTYIADRVVEYIKSVEDDERPLALWASFCSPHHPVDPPAEYADRYADTPVPGHIFSPNELETKPPEHQLCWHWDKADEETRLRSWRYYYATIELVDEQIGRVLDALRHTRRFDDTLIIFTADHGEMLWQHGLYDKAFCFYDDVYRVPTLIRWPGQLTPGRYGGLVESIDLVPALLAAGGVAMPQRMNARSVLDQIAGRIPPRESVLAEHFNIRMVRTRNAKLVVYGGRPHGELYDLDEDPQECVNLWDESAASTLRRDMERLLLDRLIESVDPASRLLSRPTNKGAYHEYLRQRPDLAARYAPNDVSSLMS